MEDQKMPSTVQPLNDDESPMDGVTSDTKLKEEPDLVKVNGDAHTEAEGNMGQESPVSPSDNGDAFQCKLCTFIAPSFSILEEHRNVHMGRKPFKCEECGFASAYQNSLLQHMQLHRENIQKGPDSPSEEEMDDHGSMNGNDALLAQENMLEVDQEGAARGDRQPSVYQCKLCTYIAPTKTHLNEHMNVHSGNKPYKCLVCGFSSSFRSSLMRHLIVHTGTAKMFKCDRCLYQTPYKCNLVTHRKKKHPEAMYGVDFGSFLTHDEIHHENNTGKMTSPSKNMDINSMYNSSLTTVFPGAVMTNSVGINRMGNISPVIGPGHALDSTAPHRISHSTFNHSGSTSVSLPNSGLTPNSTSNSYTQDLPMADEGSRTSPGSADGYTPHHASRTIGGDASHSESTSGNNNGTGRNEQAVAIDFSNTAQLSAEESSAASDNSGPVASDVQSLTSSPGGITSPIMSPSDNIPPITTSATSPSTVNEISVITPLQLQQQKSYEEMLEKPFGAKKRKRKPTPLPVAFGKRYTMEINREREAALARKAYEEGLTGRSEGDVPYLSSRPIKSRILPGNAFITSTSGNVDHAENSLIQTASDITNTSSYSLVKASDYHLGSEESHYGYRVHHENMKGPTSTHLRKRNVETQTIPGENDTDENLASKAHIQTCPYCGTMFPEQVIYSLHMSCHGSEHPFQCSICQYVCRDKIEFTCHITRSQHTR